MILVGLTLGWYFRVLLVGFHHDDWGHLWYQFSGTYDYFRPLYPRFWRAHYLLFGLRAPLFYLANLTFLALLGISIHGLFRRMGYGGGVPLAASALFLTNPAWHSPASWMAVNTHVILLLLVLATASFLRWVEDGSWPSFVLLLVAGAAVLLFHDEGMLLPLFAAAVVPAVRGLGERGVRRRLVAALTTLLAASALAAVHFLLVVLPRSPATQGGQYDLGPHVAANFVKMIVAMAIAPLWHAILALPLGDREARLVLLAIVGALLLVSAAAILSRRGFRWSAADCPCGWRRLVPPAALIVAGTAPYLAFAPPESPARISRYLMIGGLGWSLLSAIVALSIARHLVSLFPGAGARAIPAAAAAIYLAVSWVGMQRDLSLVLGEAGQYDGMRAVVEETLPEIGDGEPVVLMEPPEGETGFNPLMPRFAGQMIQVLLRNAGKPRSAEAVVRLHAGGEGIPPASHVFAMRWRRAANGIGGTMRLERPPEGVR